MSFQKETEKVAGDASAVLGVVKVLAYPLTFIAGVILGLLL